MEIIGITGKSGSGKSTFASLLSKKLNCQHIDIDKIGHRALLQPEIIDSLCDKFGTSILDKNSKINRKKLGNIVFEHEDKMQELTNLTWEYMQKVLDNILEQNNNIIVLEWILLPRSKYWDNCNSKILVTSNLAQRKNIVLKRDNISEEYFDKRDSSSVDYSPFKFDYIFENDYKLETINNMIDKISNKYIKGEEI